MKSVGLETLFGGSPDAVKLAETEGTNAGATATLAAPGSGYQYLVYGFGGWSDSSALVTLKFGAATQIEGSLTTNKEESYHRDLAVPLPAGDNVAVSCVVSASTADCHAMVYALKVPV